MPTLLDKIKAGTTLVKRGNQLFDLVNESTTTQAQRQGIPLAGTVSPLASADMGANQDQAKMAGSSAQLQNVERQAVRPSFSQRQVEEMKQARTEPSALEKKRQEQAASLSQFGDRIGGIVKQATSRMVADATKAASAAVPLSLNEETWNNLDLDQTTKDSLKPAMVHALAGTASPEELTSLAAGLGLSPTATKEQIAARINDFRQTPQNTIISSLQSVLPDQLTVGQLSEGEINALGFASKEQLASSLGLAPEEINNKSIQDLQSAVSSLQQSDYSSVKLLQTMASDPNLSPAARTEAQNALRQMGIAGVTATEEDFNKLNERVQSADKLDVAGTKVSVNELLSDPFISSMVKAYFSDVEYAKHLKETEPELAAFIEQNKTALADASKDLKADVASLAETQAKNAAYSKTSDGIPISDDINKVIYGEEWGKFSSVPLTESSFYSIANSKDLSHEFRTNYVDMMTNLAKSNPSLAKQFSLYSFDQLKAAGLNTADTMLAYKSYVNQVTSFNKMSDPVQAIQTLFPDINSLNQTITQSLALTKAGLLKDPLASKILYLFNNEPLNLNDTSPEGVYKIKRIYNTLRQFMGADSSSKMLLPIGSYGYPVNLSSVPNPDAIKSKLDENLAKAKADPIVNAVSDGKITEDELPSMTVNRGAEDLQSVLNKLSQTGMITNQVSSKLADIIKVTIDKEFNDKVLKELNLPEDILVNPNKLPDNVGPLLERMNALKKKYPETTYVQKFFLLEDALLSHKAKLERDVAQDYSRGLFGRGPYG